MPQLTHPEFDATTSGWSKTPSGVASFATRLQEYPGPNDADFVTSPPDPKGSLFEVKLWGGLGWPEPLADGHILRVRLRKTDSGSLSATIILLQGTAPIAIRQQALTTTLTTYPHTLTPDEVARITDYTNLRVRVIVGDPVVGCCEEPIPRTLYVTINDVSSNCPEINGVHFVLTWDGSSWSRPQSGYGYDKASVSLTCTPDAFPAWSFSMNGECVPGSFFGLSTSAFINCSPFSGDTGSQPLSTSGAPCCENTTVVASISSTPPP